MPPSIPRTIRPRSVTATVQPRPSPHCKASQTPRARCLTTATAPRPNNFFSYTSRNGTQQNQYQYGKKAPVAFERYPTPELYDRLSELAARGKHNDVMAIVHILVQERGEQPNLRLYSAILHSYVSPKGGTVGKVAAILKEMENEGIELDARTCHILLEVLAVHPDYLLRSEILEYMRERWYTVTERGHNFIVAGLLRERQFELALEKMDAMTRQDIRVQPWVNDLAMYCLLDFGEVEEAYQIALARRKAGDKTISPALWTHFLDCASKIHHLPATKLVWSAQVTPSHIHPSSGTLSHVLNCAARHGAVTLATDVFRVLSDRKAVFTQAHYESLLEAYINANDLPTALSVLIIMAEAGVKVDEGSTTPLLPYLTASPSEPASEPAARRPLAAFEILRDLEAEGRKVPTAAVNACIKASIALEDLPTAIEIYKTLHTISAAGPDTHTFNVLFSGCHRQGRKELAMFFAQEMIKLDVKADALTYDRLVLVCVNADDLDDAFAYYEEMRGLGFELRNGTWMALVRRCRELGDGRLESVVRDMKASGVAVPNVGALTKRLERREVGDESLS